jgi:hypothetical protein
MAKDILAEVVKDISKKVLKSRRIRVYRKMQNLRITAPLDKASVPRDTLVAGTVTDPNATVWIIIRPKDSPDHYVHHPGIKVQRDGTWSGKVYIGREGPSPDVGKRYEIMAVVDPEENLENANRLRGGWPRAEYESEIIEVVRK